MSTEEQTSPPQQGVPVPVAGASYHGFDTGQAFQAISQRLWLLVITPIIALVVALIWAQFEPYQTSVRATVLFPGDTEETGSAERPELMILDDLPLLIRSHAFAEAVLAGMASSDLSVDDVKDSLNGSRYSRVLTVTISGDSRDDVSAIAESVSAQLPALINDYLVPEEGKPATVRIIDPPGEPDRSRDNQPLRLLLVAATALLGGALLAIMAGPKQPRAETGQV